MLGPLICKKTNLKLNELRNISIILAEINSDYFDIDRESPYMLQVAQIKKERQIPMRIREELFVGKIKCRTIKCTCNYSLIIQLN